MGFLDYARNISLEKDPLKIRYLVTKEADRPRFFRDGIGCTAIIPEPKIDNDTISYLGYSFSDESWGRKQVVRLFRASVFHMCAHAVLSDIDDHGAWMRGKNWRLSKFVESLIEDIKANALLVAKHKDKVVDLSIANALALRRMRRITGLLTPATRIMTSLVVYCNMGLRSTIKKNDENIVYHLIEEIDQLKEVVHSSLIDESVDVDSLKLSAAEKIYDAIRDRSAIVEVPSLPHTDELEPCSLFPHKIISSNDVDKEILDRCLEALGGSGREDSQQTWKKVVEAEALQVFDSWSIQKEKEKKILSKYLSPLQFTRFKSVEFPRQDYSKYVETKTACRSETRRLISSLLVARDALDEDPQKPYGVLDLQDVIQVLASKSPRMDIFMLDEYIDKSYAWAILIDASRSMYHVREHALEIAVILADAANELLVDTTAWGMYAFNDRFLVIKDNSESYNSNVKSRIGGIRFEGLTYMPDALEVAGHILKSKVENLKLITIISDGWPYGYLDINTSLNKTIDTLEKGDIIIIGIGAKTKRMGGLFKTHLTASTLKDVTKKFSDLYLEASKNVY